jgi:hypothetical protein
LIFSSQNLFKPALAERDKKQTMIGLRGVSTNWLKNLFCPAIRLSRLRALKKAEEEILEL